jgi:hypothetical protein
VPPQRSEARAVRPSRSRLLLRWIQPADDEQPRPADGAVNRCSPRPAVVSLPGARRPAGNGPGSSPGPPPRADPPSRWSNGGSRYASRPHLPPGTGPDCSASSSTSSTTAASTTATCPTWPLRWAPWCRLTAGGPSTPATSVATVAEPPGPRVRASGRPRPDPFASACQLRRRTGLETHRRSTGERRLVVDAQPRGTTRPPVAGRTRTGEVQEIGSPASPHWRALRRPS